MMPFKEFQGPLGIALLIFGATILLFMSDVPVRVAPQSVTSPMIAGAISHTRPYPAVRVEVPSTSIFSQDSSY